ncbi:MAG: GHMP kinase [Chloroflexi bacterium]|nr:MAG: GHMP kinase [Chloroflexota bacterium]
MIYRARAPLRISFCGGGTDVSPYPEERGGVVLSSTIDKYAYASLRPRDDDAIEVRSLDYDIVAKYDRRDALPYDGELDLVKAVINHYRAPAGMELFLHSDAPPGSGLGSSSTLIVALLGVFRHWLKLTMTEYELASLAYQIERVDIGIAGGKQDQYAAAFGGFNFIEFHADSVIVNPLRVEPATLFELQYRLLLCYTGQTRLSAMILSEQTAGYIQRRAEVVAALDGMKALAIQLKNALLLNKLSRFGDLLHEAWLLKRQLATNISDAHIDRLYEIARDAGAIGGKLLGAGGGGYLLLFCPFERKHIIAAELEEAGAQPVDFAFEEHGLQTWIA